MRVTRREKLTRLGLATSLSLTLNGVVLYFLLVPNGEIPEEQDAIELTLLVPQREERKPPPPPPSGKGPQTRVVAPSPLFAPPPTTTVLSTAPPPQVPTGVASAGPAPAPLRLGCVGVAGLTRQQRRDCESLFAEAGLAYAAPAIGRTPAAAIPVLRLDAAPPAPEVGWKANGIGVSYGYGPNDKHFLPGFGDTDTKVGTRAEIHDVPPPTSRWEAPPH